MSKKIILFAVSVFLLSITFSNIKAQTDDNLTKLKYFKILATTSDDSLFLNVQKELSIDPFVDAYLLIVNISLENNDNHYIVFGEENDPYSIRMRWLNLSIAVRDGLVAWSKPNKMNIVK